MATALDEPSTASALQVLQRQCLLLSVCRRRWPGRYTLPIGNVTVEGLAIDDTRVTRPQIRLIPDFWDDKLNKVYNRVARTVERFTLPFRFGGARAMPLTTRQVDGEEVATAQLFFDEIAALRAELQELVAAFAEDLYGGILTGIRDYWQPILGDAYQRVIAQRIPERQQLPDRFSIDIGVFEINEASLSQVALPALRQHLEQAKQQTQADVEAAISDLVLEPRKKLVAALEQMQTQLTTGQRLTAASFNAARDALELLRNFSNTVDAELLGNAATLATAIEHALAVGGARRSSATFAEALTPLRPALSAAADEVLRAARDTGAAQAIYAKIVPGRRLILGDD